ncbi:MAG: large subunit ribosomal protein L20, partial [Myxococcota bacterium]
AYRDRRTKKRTMRALWIVRINAASRQLGVRYSELMNWLLKADITLDRRVLANVALEQPEDFKQIVDTAKRLAQG